jgi:tetratricopeptide (TPR) repeat protein
VYVQLEDYLNAERFLPISFRQKVMTLGREHLSTISSMIQVGILYQHENKFVDAETILRECLDISMIQGEKHHYTLSCKMNLAIVYSKQSKYDDAIILFEQCAAEQQQRQNIAEVLTCMYHVATIRLAQKDYRTAEELLIQCLMKRKQLFGDDHPCVLNTMSTIAYNYDLQDILEKANEWYSNCYLQCERIRGQEDKLTLAFLFNHALVFERQERYEIAEIKYAVCYERRKNVLGEYHLDTIAALHGLADVTLALRKYAIALHMFEICYDQHKKMLGDMHEETQAAWESLKWLRGRLKLSENLIHIKSEGSGQTKEGPNEYVAMDDATSYLM